MDPNSNDEVFVADGDIDSGFRARANMSRSVSRKRINKSGQSSPAPESLNETAPLLNDEEHSRPNTRESNESGGNVPWFGLAELEGLPWWKRPSIYWLLPPFLLFAMAFGAVVVPKLNLILDLICNDYYASHNGPSNQDPISGPMDPGNEFDRCRTDDISSRASLFLLYGSLFSGFLSAIMSPKLGSLSDRYGRKKILILTAIGVFVGEILTILAAKYPETVDVNWILVGYAIDGLCGSFILGMAIAHSYAADCTPPQKRNVAFGYFHACLFTGIAVGPVLAGYVIKKREPIVGKSEAVLLIFYVALACHVIFIAFLLFLIPESLSKGRQAAAQEKYRRDLEALGPASDWINQLRNINIFEPLKILYPQGPGSSRAIRINLLLLAATDTIMFSVAMGAMGVITLYVRRQFGWQEWESSKFISIVNACRVVSLLVVLPLITRLVRGKQGTSKQANSGSDRFDLAIIRIAIFFDMIGYLGFSLVSEGYMFTLSGAVASFGSMGSPTLGSALTKHVPPDRVGQLLGATGLLHALARIIGPTIFNGIYSATVYNFKQTVFVALTATFGLSFLCSWFVRPHVYLEDLESDGSPSQDLAASDEEARSR